MIVKGCLVAMVTIMRALLGKSNWPRCADSFEVHVFELV